MAMRKRAEAAGRLAGPRCRVFRPDLSCCDEDGAVHSVKLTTHRPGPRSDPRPELAGLAAEATWREQGYSRRQRAGHRAEVTTFRSASAHVDFLAVRILLDQPRSKGGHFDARGTTMQAPHKASPFHPSATTSTASQHSKPHFQGAVR